MPEMQVKGKMPQLFLMCGAYHLSNLIVRGYIRVRHIDNYASKTTTPARVRKMGDEERDLSSPSLSEDQTEGLLADWREKEEEEAQDYATSTKRRLYWVVIFVATVTSIAAIVAVDFLVKPLASTQEDIDMETTTNDYILEGSRMCQGGPIERKYHWTVRDHVYNPDGFYKKMILVNNQFPGPLIEACEGDTIEVQLSNQAHNSTSIHWHGIYQNGTSDMDGTIGVTQSAIASKDSFVYRFTVRSQTGTYWWHAHQAVQSSDGLHGPLIIHGKNEVQSVPYDTDRVILVSDHYHTLSSAQLWQYLQPDNENNEPVPVGGLVNGRSIRKCEDIKSSRPKTTTTGHALENTCKHTKNVAYPRIQLGPDKSHRLRLINVGAFAEFQVQLDEHELTMIEVEGTDVQPVQYKRVQISPAQRYSVVVTMGPVESDSLYWFRARMVVNCFADGPILLHPGPDQTALYPDALAVVHHNEVTTDFPTSSDWEEGLATQCAGMNSTELVPLDVMAAPEADSFFYFQISVKIRDNQLARLYFNDSTYRLDEITAPALDRALLGLRENDPAFSPPDDSKAWINDKAFNSSHEYVLQTTNIQIIDILVSNLDDGAHPLHLHGYKFWVLAQGHGYPPRSEITQDLYRANLDPLYDNLDLTNPIRRDTVVVEAFGWTLIRVLADNPGAWALHCHIAWHSEAGLAMLLLSRTDDMMKEAHDGE